MTEKVKLDLIGTLVSHYYEFMCTAEEGRNSAALEAIVDIIDTIIAYEGLQDTVANSPCSCHGECNNCLE